MSHPRRGPSDRGDASSGLGLSNLAAVYSSLSLCSQGLSQLAMNTARFICTIFAFLLLVIGTSAEAQDTTGADRSSIEAEETTQGPRDADFPPPFWGALLAIAVCGAVGGFAADLAADAGILARGKRTAAHYQIGWPAKLIVGTVAALVILTLNPPGGWASLIGTALIAGLGGESVLMPIINARKAQAAEAQTEKILEAGKAVDQMAHVAAAYAQGAAATSGDPTLRLDRSSLRPRPTQAPRARSWTS